MGSSTSALEIMGYKLQTTKVGYGPSSEHELDPPLSRLYFLYQGLGLSNKTC